MTIKNANEIKIGDKIKADNGQEGIVTDIKNGFITIDTGAECSDIQLQMFIDKGLMTVTRK
jgi:preprotein translocase subunit YajC